MAYILRSFALTLVLAAAAAQGQFNPHATGSPAAKSAPKAAPAVQTPSWGAPPAAAPVAESAGGSATVYFYREGIDNMTRKATINVDGRPVCSLSTGRYFEVMLPPGEHSFAGPDLQQAAPLNLEPGRQYYFKATVDRSTVRKALFSIHNVFRIDPVTAETGSFDVKRLKPLEGGEAKP